MNTIPSKADSRYRELPVDIKLLLELHAKVMANHARYGLGAKVPLAADSSSVHQVDCSGYYRWLIARATSLKSQPVDGSQNQWVEAVKSEFKKSNVVSGKLKDKILRVAFLDDDDSKSHIGHVALIYNGETIESWGKKGPDSRPWTGKGWQEDAHIFVLARF